MLVHFVRLDHHVLVAVRRREQWKRIVVLRDRRMHAFHLAKDLRVVMGDLRQLLLVGYVKAGDADQVLGARRKRHRLPAWLLIDEGTEKKNEKFMKKFVFPKHFC